VAAAAGVPTRIGTESVPLDPSFVVIVTCALNLPPSA
jgi:hypothetical protein